ncbi:mitochondrial carrier protein MTM1-like isoform X2 [Hibiscus syriacus]|uniref:Mitochondrial carrier protein MTM1-like isoform X2 n=1 Tax=Hibiscus syriacus TaxID=106335 RepID=A0A6A3CVA1_HIBSY|nr:mitochondrial carrier protein MTM1-like isoform X2 [Hibiscus syriacus]
MSCNKSAIAGSEETKKVYSEVLNLLRLNLPISLRTPQPGSPYKPRLQKAGYLSPTVATTSLEPSPTSSTSSVDNTELVVNSKSPIANVEMKFSSPNLVLKTMSPRIPGQTLKIIS